MEPEAQLDSILTEPSGNPLRVAYAGDNHFRSNGKQMGYLPFDRNNSNGKLRYSWAVKVCVRPNDGTVIGD